MNETIRQIYERKSVRVFTDEPITSEQREAILHAAIQAPTAGNMSLYSIIDVQEQKLKDILAERCDNQPFIAKAPLVLLFLVDWKKWVDIFEAHGMPVNHLEESDLLLGAQDCMAAAQNAVIAAQSMGIGSCYIGDILENVEANRELFHIPSHATPFALLVFGYPTEQQKARTKPVRFDINELVHINHYTPLEGNDLEAAFQHHSGHKDQDGFEHWIKAFANRKFFCDFRKEMNRSCRKILELWLR